MSHGNESGEIAPDHAEVGEYRERRCRLGLTWPNRSKAVRSGSVVWNGAGQVAENARVAPWRFDGGREVSLLVAQFDVNRMPRAEAC